MTPSEHSSAEAATEGRFVLVIDDDREARNMLHRELTSAGFRVTAVSTGPAGLELARRQRPDAITLDIMMSGTSGWSVLTALKSDPTLASVPVIILSVIPDAGLTFHLDVADFLVKPLDGERLASLLEQFPPASAKDPVLVVSHDLPTRATLQRLVCELGGQVTTAANVLDALYVLCTDVPGIIVLDLTLPAADLLPLLGALRETERWQTIPILGLTPMDLTLEERRSLDVVVQHVLGKGSLPIEAFVRQLKNTLSRHS